MRNRGSESEGERAQLSSCVIRLHGVIATVLLACRGAYSLPYLLLLLLRREVITPIPLSSALINSDSTGACKVKKLRPVSKIVRVLICAKAYGIQQQQAGRPCKAAA